MIEHYKIYKNEEEIAEHTKKYNVNVCYLKIEVFNDTTYISIPEASGKKARDFALDKATNGVHSAVYICDYMNGKKIRETECPV